LVSRVNPGGGELALEDWGKARDSRGRSLRAALQGRARLEVASSEAQPGPGDPALISTAGRRPNPRTETTEKRRPPALTGIAMGTLPERMTQERPRNDLEGFTPDPWKALPWWIKAAHWAGYVLSTGLFCFALQGLFASFQSVINPGKPLEAPSPVSIESPRYR
jgi:hypothetical protein